MSWFSKSILDEPARIVGKRHVAVMDGECVDRASDYVPVIRELAAITGVLHFDRIECEEVELADDEDDPEATRIIRLARGDRTWTGRVQGNGWVDSERLLALLDRVLAELGVAKRLHSIHHARWGQELGVVFAGEAELAELRTAGYTIESDKPPGPPDDETLAAERVIHGLRFRAGTVVEYWHDPPFDEMAVTLAEPHDLAGLHAPAGAYLMFEESGAILCCIIGGKRIPFDHGWRHDLAEDGY